MSQCIIHVGMHKTGSSSIQTTFSNLDNQKFHYTQIFHSPNHSRQVVTGFASEPGQYRLNRVQAHRGHDFQRRVRQIRRELAQSLKTANLRTSIISGEDILLLNTDELAVFRDFLQKLGKDPIIFAYVRPPADYMNSYFQHSLRGGNLIKLFSVEDAYPNYFTTFSKFDTIFGKENVKLRKYNRAILKEQDVVVDFADQIGIDMEKISIARVNESWPKEVLMLLYQYRAHSKHLGLNGLNIKNLKKAGFFALFENERFRLSPKLINPSLEKNRGDVEWMEKRLGTELADTPWEASDGDIQNEADMFCVVEGLREKIIGALTEAGRFNEKNDSSTVYHLMHEFSELGGETELRRTDRHSARHRGN